MLTQLGKTWAVAITKASFGSGQNSKPGRCFFHPPDLGFGVAEKTGYTDKLTHRDLNSAMLPRSLG